MNEPDQHKDEIEAEIEKALALTVQVTRIGRATDPKPKDRVWFTTMTQDLFVLELGTATAAIQSIIKTHTDKLVADSYNKGYKEGKKDASSK